MHKTMLLLALALSGSVVAQEQADKKEQLCPMAVMLAGQIMEARQDGASKAAMMEVTEKKEMAPLKGMAVKLTDAAFSVPQQKDQPSRMKAVVDFQNAIYQACNES